MQEYINEYQNINGEFASIISKSLEADNLQVHAKAASFMDDFQQWIELLSDSYEVILYKEAFCLSIVLCFCFGVWGYINMLLFHFEAILRQLYSEYSFQPMN